MFKKIKVGDHTHTHTPPGPCLCGPGKRKEVRRGRWAVIALLVCVFNILSSPARKFVFPGRGRREEVLNYVFPGRVPCFTVRGKKMDFEAKQTRF